MVLLALLRAAAVLVVNTNLVFLIRVVMAQRAVAYLRTLKG
jgi:hypothetical protein